MHAQRPSQTATLDRVLARARANPYPAKTAIRFIPHAVLCHACGQRHGNRVFVAHARDVGTDRFGHPRRRWVYGAARSDHPFMTGDERYCGCGGVIGLRRIDGRVNRSVRCDSRCTQARGFKCECSCGGRNHGAGHS